MTGAPVLIAGELRELLDDEALAGLDVTWLRADEPTPAGAWSGIVPLLSRWIGGNELKRLPELRVIANCAVGYNNVDLVAAEMRKVVVTNTPDVLTAATADLTWALILACARRLPAALELVKSGNWSGWHPQLLLGTELDGATLGIVGAGRIGQAVGRRAVGFGMRIRYTDRSSRPAFEQATGAVRLELKPLLRESDVVTLHVPRTLDTQGLMGPETLALMKPGAILINTSRGDVVREEAVAVALEEGRLGAAGLDVFADEPEIHPRLRAATRAVLLPHIGSATLPTRRRMAGLAVANARAVLSGAPPLTPVIP